MPRRQPPPTPAVAEQILAFIRAGGYPHVAAEAAHVPRETFEEWLERGRAARRGLLRDFYLELRHAHAQARLRAEIHALKEKPMDWLRYGPGKETADNPGWSAAARARSAADAAPASVLEHPELLGFFRALLDVLQGHPAADRDVREAFAGVLPRAVQSRRRPA